MTGNVTGNLCGIKRFKQPMPGKTKKIKLMLFALMGGVLFLQCCYWLFANSAVPVLLGMPFGMFFIVMVIVLQFFLLLALYLIESGEMKD